MNTKEEVKRKQVKSAIDYRKYYINYISAQIQDLLKELREINKWIEIEEKNRELSNNTLGKLKI